jgi:D-galactose 1-dehydrogenase
MQPIRVGIVGVGKIARDQHIPAIAANPAFELSAASSRHAQAEGVNNFNSLQQMLAAMPGLDAISICTPPQMHYEMARLALNSGKHVLMEKPPCSSLLHLLHLAELASARELTLYQTWHSQHAAGVKPARDQLAGRKLKAGKVTWKEDVRVWHPGQAWIWEAGGFGVLDPGINALSILTKLIHEPLFVRAATLYVPANCETPIAAQICLVCDGGALIDVELDFRHTGTQTWDIDLETDVGPLKLSAGGGQLTVGSVPVPDDSGKLQSEYQSIYRRFAELIAQRDCEVDMRPMQLVADIFLVGKRITVEDFSDPPI